MDKQALFDKIKAQTGQDFSRNRGIKSYLAMIDGDKRQRVGVCIRALYNAFLPHTDALTAMAAAITCANRYFNGGQMAGFGGYWEFQTNTKGPGKPKKNQANLPSVSRSVKSGSPKRQYRKDTNYYTHREFILPEDQLSAVVSKPEQTLKTFKAIKPETLEKYKHVITITNQFQSGKE